MAHLFIGSYGPQLEIKNDEHTFVSSRLFLNDIGNGELCFSDVCCWFFVTQPWSTNLRLLLPCYRLVFVHPKGDPPIGDNGSGPHR